ncbi:MAG: cysteine rich repeat-containing protein [Pseudomonadota bacterium]
MRSIIAMGAIALVGALGFATAAGAQTPTQAQRDALRANCAGDFRANCAGVSPGGMGALLCLEQNEAKLSPGCKGAVDAVKGPPSPPASKPAAAAPASAPAAPDASAAARAPAAEAAPKPAPRPAATATAPERRPPPPLSLRQEVRIGARACFGDFSRFCPELPLGHGNMMGCLRLHAAQLSPRCHDAMARAGAALR